MEITDLLRPNIKKLAPYTCARDEFSGTASAWLDANENSRIYPFNRYPDPLQAKVKERLSALRGVAPGCIFLGVGSDECIDITYRVFCRPGIDNVVAIKPTYGMYRVCADINDVEYRTALLNNDFTINTDRIFQAIDGHTKVLWICSPNNPTGNAFPPSDIEDIADRFQGITVVDEAYVDFSPYGSMLRYLDRHPRMIVMQTLSKAWAGAELRLGIAFASEEIINVFNKVKYPYNISGLTQRQAITLLDDADRVTAIVKELTDARMGLTAELVMLPQVLHVYNSDANFLLVKVTDPDGIYSYLCNHGIVVRNRSRVALCGGCLRITVGTDEENRMLIDTLSRYGEL